MLQEVQQTLEVLYQPCRSISTAYKMIRRVLPGFKAQRPNGLVVILHMERCGQKPFSIFGKGPQTLGMTKVYLKVITSAVVSP